MKGYLYEFGFMICRLRESKESEEYLIFDRTKNSFNQYGRKRAISFLLKEFELRKINVYDFAKNELSEQNPKRSKDLIEEWFEDEYFLIDNMSYEPEGDFIFTEEGKEFLNIYRKSTFFNKYKKSNEYEFPKLKRFILNLVDNDLEAYDWLTQWLADTLQYPKEKVLTGIIFQGDQGTGKSVLSSKVLKPIFEKNYIEIGQAQVNSEFNSWAFGKQIIIANEVVHQENKFSVPDKIKNLVTDETIPLRRMQKDAINVRNYSRIIFNSNHMIPLKLERTDRRFSVFKSKGLGQKGLQWYKEFSEVYDLELTNFVNFLYSLDVDKSLINRPFENEARKDLMRYNQNSVEE